MARAGAKVYLYNKGYFHCKTINIDSVVCAVGTISALGAGTVTVNGAGNPCLMASNPKYQNRRLVPLNTRGMTSWK